MRWLLWSSCHCCPKCMGLWHLGQVGWAPCAMRISHSCRSFWCWFPYPRWVVVPLALLVRRLCSLQYRSLGWTSFGHRAYAQTLRLMARVSPALSGLEHHAGFEPATTAWRAGVIPVSPMMRGGRSCLPGWIPAWSLSPPMCASVAVSTAEGTVSTSCGSAVADMDCAPESLRFSGHNANQRFDYNAVR